MNYPFIYLFLFLVIVLAVLFKKYKTIKHEKNPDYKNRKLINLAAPKFKLKAYCINLKGKKNNFKFIQKEWNNHLNVERFVALYSATASHLSLLCKIYLNKEKEQFPIVIMEDDVFRKNNFNKYWNELKNIENCDYICFDAFYLKFNKRQSPYENFVALSEHRAMGFTVYYKRFFDRFSNVSLLKAELDGTIDINFTHNPTFINFTPKEQVCRQIVSKTSMSNQKHTAYYNKQYQKAEQLLADFAQSTATVLVEKSGKK
jgi:hypothetical protein